MRSETVKKILLGWLCLGLVAAVIGLVVWRRQVVVQTTRSEEQDAHVPKVVTSFYPVYYFTTRLAGDDFQVTNLTPAGVEPHDFEPTPSDLQTIQSASLIIVNGAGLEPWSERVAASDSQIASRMVTTSQGLTDQQLSLDGKTSLDPHVWLDPVLASQQVTTIAAALVRVQPERAATITARAQQLQAELAALHAEFVVGLQKCQQHQVITSHAAFGYVAARYGFTQVSIQGLSPDSEPSLPQLATLAKTAREQELHYIFFETLVSPKLAETLAREIGAKTLVFNPLEGLTPQELQAGETYFSVQRQNLANLRLGLECE